MGFEEVKTLRIGAYDAKSFRRDDLWLFDVRPMNFVMNEIDEIVPIDVIVQRDAR